MTEPRRRCHETGAQSPGTVAWNKRRIVMKLRSKILVMGNVLAAALIASAAIGAAFASAAGDQAAGKTLFTSTGCGGCHTLADAGASGKSASNLDTLKPSFEVTLNSLINSPSGMPSNSLSSQQREDLATYVAAVAGNQSGGDGGGGGGESSNTVRVSLKSGWKIHISPRKATAGTVTFKITNKTKRIQQFTLIRASKKHKSKKSRAKAKKKARVKLSKRWRRWHKKCRVYTRKRDLIGNMCKIGPGKTRTMRRKLRVGRYYLVNAVPGSYTKGRHSTLRVVKATQPSPSSPGTEPLSAAAQAFVDAGCGGCHTLSDARTVSTVATNLDIAKPSYSTVSDVVTDGMLFKFQSSSVDDLDEMPAYSASLSPQQIHDMANYVSTVTGGDDGSGQPAGRQNFLLTGCASCHTLADVGGTASDPGGSESYSNLDIAKPSFTTAQYAVTTGYHHMPKYLTGSKNVRHLTAGEIDDVATYLSTVTGGPGQGVAQDDRQIYLAKGCSSCHTLADAGGVGERASSIDIGKPASGTVTRLLQYNMGTSSSASPKRYGLTPGMPNYTTSISAGDRTAIATYLSTITGASEAASSGRQLSLVGGCGNCHIIANTDGLAKGTPVGGDLDILKPSSFVTDLVMTLGVGTQPPPDTTQGMPCYLNGCAPTSPDDANKFTAAEIDDVAEFIRQATGGAY